MSYPRPDIERERWTALDGTWEFQFDPNDIGKKEGWYKKRLSGTVRVPYCIESEAAGLPPGKFSPVFWYAREFPRARLPKGKRFFLNFGAVDYEADVWINGSRLGGHRGGYTPFSFEITDFIGETNRIAVRVADYPTRRTLRGKQYIYRRLSAVFYTPVSGIWQPVFIHATGDSCIKKLVLLPDMDRLTVRADIDARGAVSARVRITDADGATVAEEKSPIDGGRLERTFVIKNPRRWSVESPHLYRVQVTLYGGRNAVSDQVTAATGLRRIETKGGRVLLNGKPIYLKMLLVQGYYPGGHYTPMDEDQFEQEIIRVQVAGVQRHQDAREDRGPALPVLLRQARAAAVGGDALAVPLRGAGPGAVRARAWRGPRRATPATRRSWRWSSSTRRGGSTTSCGARKKRRFLESMYRRVKEFNPGIAVVDNSGYDHLVTDIVDIHHYLNTDEKIHALYRILGDKKRMSRQFLRLIKTAVNIVKTHVVARVPYLRQGTYRGARALYRQRVRRRGILQGGRGVHGELQA